jgi:hypothetical protein
VYNKAKGLSVFYGLYEKIYCQFFMKKMWFFWLLVFGIIFGGIFFFNIFSVLAVAEEVPFDSNIYRTECYSETADFYTDVPSSYSGSKVSLEAKSSSNPAGCADLGI